MAISPRLLTKFTKREVDELFKRAKRIYGRNGLEIRLAPSDKEYGRILIMIPKATGTAPERNKVRRQIKAIFAENDLSEYKNDLIIIVRKEAVGLPFEKLTMIITKAAHANTQ